MNHTLNEPAHEHATGLTPAEAVRVMIVDDQALFRAVARELIGAMHDFHAVVEASSGPEALEAAPRLRPQMALVDVRMPGMNGVETSRRLIAGEEGIVVVLVTSGATRDFAVSARSCGAVALVPKQRLKPQLLRDLWALHRSPQRSFRLGEVHPGAG